MVNRRPPRPTRLWRVDHRSAGRQLDEQAPRRPVPGGPRRAGRPPAPTPRQVGASRPGRRGTGRRSVVWGGDFLAGMETQAVWRASPAGDSRQFTMNSRRCREWLCLLARSGRPERPRIVHRSRSTRDGRRGLSWDDGVGHRGWFASRRPIGVVVIPAGRRLVGPVDDATDDGDGQSPQAVGGLGKQVHPADIPKHRQHDPVARGGHQERIDYRQHGSGIDHHEVEQFAHLLDQLLPRSLGEQFAGGRRILPGRQHPQAQTVHPVTALQDRRLPAEDLSDPRPRRDAVAVRSCRPTQVSIDQQGAAPGPCQALRHATGQGGLSLRRSGAGDHQNPGSG